jgi:DNA-binding NtrC family response regulator
MSRILIHDPRPEGGEYRTLLASRGHEVVVCREREATFDALALRRPDALVYVLADATCDLAILSLLRRFAPQVPLILLGAAADLRTRRAVQELKPIYYGVFPLDPTELRDAVLGALGRRDTRPDRGAGRALAS